MTNVKRIEIDSPNPTVTSLKLYTKQGDEYIDSTGSVLWKHIFEPKRKVIMVSDIPVTGFIEIS